MFHLKTEKIYFLGRFLNRIQIVHSYSNFYVKKNSSRKIIYDNWVWRKFGLIPEEIAATGFFFLIIGLLFTIFAWIFSTNILITLMFLLISMSIYYFIQIMPYSEAKKDKYRFEQSLEQLLLDYSLILESASAEEEVLLEIRREIEKLCISSKILNTQGKDSIQSIIRNKCGNFRLF